MIPLFYFKFLIFYSSMEYRTVDETAEHPVSDVVLHNSKVIVSRYDRSIKMYSGSILLSTIYLPTPITKICSYFERILAISMTSGLLYILDSNLVLLDVISGFDEATMIIRVGKRIAIACYSRFIHLLEEQCVSVAISESFEDKTYSIEDVEMKLKQQHCFKCIATKKYAKIATSSDFMDGRLAISFENLLVLMNEDLQETYSKEFSCCINTISLFDDGVLVGLINGRIHCENIVDSEESFVFNSHVELRPTKKIFFPTTQLMYKKYLFSSGADGKIIKWDIKNKRQILTIFDGRDYVRKFLLANNRIYAILDNINEIEHVSRLVYVPFESL